MTTMSERNHSIDPYHEWLDIPPEDQPPSFYRLLGVQEFESDAGIIDQAAKARTAYLHPMAAGPERESVQRLLSEIAKARRTLLSTEVKRTYDEGLRSSAKDEEAPGSSVAPMASPAVEIPSIRVDTEAGSSKPSKAKRGRKAAAKRNSGRIDSGEQKAGDARTIKRGRVTENAPSKSRVSRKTWVHDWRLHAASIMTLLLLVISYVLYKNSRADKRAAVPLVYSSPATVGASAALPAAGSLSRSATKRNVVVGTQSDPRAARARNQVTRRSAGDNSKEKPKSSLAKALESMQAGSGVNDAAKATSSDRKQPKKIPDTAPVKLSENWLQGLPIVAEVTGAIDDVYDVRKGRDLLKMHQNGLVIKPAGGSDRYGSAVAKKVKAGLGETVAFESNLRRALPDSMRVGLIVGPIRIRLESKKKNLHLLINERRLGDFAPPKNVPVRIAVVRSADDARAFRWIVQAGGKALSGRAKLQQDVMDSVQVGLLFSAPRKGIAKPIYMQKLRVGVLDVNPDYQNTRVVELHPQK